LPDTAPDWWYCYGWDGAGVPAGRRVFSFPREIAPELRWHPDRFVKPGADSLVFVARKAAACVGPTSATYRSPREIELACPGCTCMTCCIRET
jgi:hypothetical protein